MASSNTRNKAAQARRQQAFYQAESNLVQDPVFKRLYLDMSRIWAGIAQRYDEIAQKEERHAG